MSIRFRNTLLALLGLAAAYGVYKMGLAIPIRAKNPLNIRETQRIDYEWVGEDIIDVVDGYEEFIDPKYSFRAGTRILRNYRKRGIYSVEDIIYEWAPPEDNNHTAEYLDFVLKRTGFQPGHIPVEQEGDLLPLFKAMAIFESGRVNEFHPYLSDDTIKAGIALA